MSIRKHDIIVLRRDLPALQLRAGDVGAVTQVCANGQIYQVEFATGAGRTVAVATLDSCDVTPPGAGEIMHMRRMNAA